MSVHVGVSTSALCLFVWVCLLVHCVCSCGCVNNIVGVSITCCVLCTPMYVCISRVGIGATGVTLDTSLITTTPVFSYLKSQKTVTAIESNVST